MNAPTSRTIQQIIGRITVSELCQAIDTTMKTGQAGVPVNVRLHWEFQEPAAELGRIAIGAVTLADRVLRLDKPVWRVRRHSSERILNIIGTDRGGRSLMISLVAESLPWAALTVFGNHGIVRLDSSFNWIDPESISEPAGECSWLAEFRTAIADGESSGV